jgi:hypothetical protein
MAKVAHERGWFLGWDVGYGLRQGEGSDFEAIVPHFLHEFDGTRYIVPILKDFTADAELHAVVLSSSAVSSAPKT